jgi:hypothetical protein
MASAGPGIEGVGYDVAADQVGGNLTELVRDYNICCDVRPKYVGTGGERRQVGFDLELLGSHSSDRYHLDPTCPMCERVRAALLAVTGMIVPKSGKSVRYEIDAYSKSIMWTSTLGNRPFLTLSIRIVNWQWFDQPIDRCEISPLIQIRERLVELGVREG